MPGMRGYFRIKRLHVWIACFAILLNALAPSISHAISASAGQTAAWAEICSVDGARLVAVGTDHAQSPDGSPSPQAQPSAHCPFCSPHAGTFALPAAAMTLPVPIAGARLLPSLFYRSPQPLFSWAAANPRAPPVSL